PCVVQRAERPGEVTVRVRSALRRVEILFEDGGSRELPPTTPVVLPADLPTGYHRLVVESGEARHETALIVTPASLRLPPGFDSAGWGVAAQLYSVRSSRSWCVGDLGDLAELAKWTGGAEGADFVLVNPLHAGEVVAPMSPSPYLPTSRRFSNPLYLRVEDVPEYASLSDDERAEVDRTGTELRAEQSGAGQIARDPVWAAKQAALQIIFDSGAHRRDAARHADYAAFVAREGDELERFARWCALSEAHGPDWHAWPQPLRDPRASAVSEAVAALAPRVDFYRWLQWQLDGQLARAQAQARAAGMRLGVIHDVAVGVSPDGADTWSWQDVLARGVTVGAPPDAYSQLGQDWNQPPWRPDRLAELAYTPLRDLFRNALRHGGGLRVDHVIGLFRLWWVPTGHVAAEGAYVRYDHEALLGILALEAQRAGAVIIGEDLGNVDPRARGYLRELGLLGTSILWFETEWGSGVPLAPEQWREYCLASVTTHDLPPSTGYLAADHIRLRDELGMLTRPIEEELAEDRREKDRWRNHLVHLGLLAPELMYDDTAVVIALHAFLARTPALLRCAALTDAVGERRTQNQPGTKDEYPNWRIPLGGPDGRPLLLEELIADRRADAVFAAVRGDRSR
ncbi:MAG TPA: 4-alpha-glucanotransferase, partial [Jatrophihabitans sp.]|nr:4-alpha-glucanotransferase [Jatrophihabitans sp.]